MPTPDPAAWLLTNEEINRIILPQNVAGEQLLKALNGFEEWLEQMPSREVFCSTLADEVREARARLEGR